MRTFITILLTLCLASQTKAQDNTHAGKLTISGYVELYDSYDLNKPADHNRPPFVYSYNRTNKVNLDLGLIRATYTNNRVKANLWFIAGTYANTNLAAGPGVMKNVYEANAGIRLSPKVDLWLDAGIFASHIGYESAAGKDCWALTRNTVSNGQYFWASSPCSLPV